MRAWPIAACMSLTIVVASGCDGDGDADADAGQVAGDGGDDGGDGDGDGDGDGYPAGPHGTEVGDVVADWVFRDGAGAEVSLAEFHLAEQPALLLYATTAWCGVCKADAVELAGLLEPLAEDVRPVGVLFEDQFSAAPTPEVAADYNATIDTFEFLADPEQHFNEIFTPQTPIARTLVIDTRDMTIRYKASGHDLEALVAAAEDVASGP